MGRMALLIFLACGMIRAADKGTLLAVFAHPDDETVIGPLLAKYAAEGHDVYLALTTSGQAGNANTDIPKGEELGAAREEEARCACRALGIHPPIFLRFMDGATAARELMPKIAERLRTIVENIRPQVIITWGPDGLTGHPDHRVVSNLTTQIFQRRSLLEHRPRKLYYAAWPESSLKNLPSEFAELSNMRAVSDEFITTEVEVEEQYAKRATQAIRCHETQWPPEQMEQIARSGTDVLGGKVYLRQALRENAGSKRREASVF